MGVSDKRCHFMRNIPSTGYFLFIINRVHLSAVWNTAVKSIFYRLKRLTFNQNH